MSFPYKRALVTGGAGFIGSHLVERLLNLGIEVISIDNYVTGKRANLAGCASPRLKEVDCDVLDYARLKTFFEGVDVVFHNAASKKTVCLRDPRLDLDTNAKGTFNLLELARDHGVRKFVHASTGSVYGEARVFPQGEDHPLNPTSYYGVSKLAGERYVFAFGQIYGMDVSALRYFHVYGPRQEAGDYGGVVAIFCRRALAGLPLKIFGDGTQMRSFTYVDAIVDANLRVASDPRTRGEVYNCASGLKITVGDLARNVLRLAGRPEDDIVYDPWTVGDVKVFDVDNRKLQALGFAFTVPFDAGLRSTFEWFKTQDRDAAAT